MPETPFWQRHGATARGAALVLALLVVIPLSWLGPLDHLARDYVETGLKRALVTFAAARAANAVISVVQETTVAISPIGVGVTTSPGQILDPVNDVVEQFSTLMLVASVSLGMQHVLITVGSYVPISVLLTMALVAWAALRWRGQGEPRWLARALIVLLFVRFAVPLAALGSEAAFRLAMAEQYAEAQTSLDTTTRVLGASAPGPEPGRDEGRLERLRRWLAEKERDFGAAMAEIRDKAENLVRHVITLMALFVVQTVLLPLLFLWIVYRMFGATVGRGGRF